MAKRRTKPTPFGADTTPLTSMKTVAHYYSPLEAHMVSGLLEDEGITCVLSNELFNTVDSPVAMSTGGVAIQVREDDFVRAASILKNQTQEQGEHAMPRRAKPSPFVWLAGLLLLGLLGVFLLSTVHSLMAFSHR